jgi:hypothetical protein
MSGRSFEDWIDCVFDHAVTEPAWYWAEDADHGIEPDEENVQYLTRLFTECDRVLQRFDARQVNQGFTFIVDSSCSDHTSTLERVAWPKRQAWIRSIYDVYAKCFAARCVDGLSHLDEAAMPFNYICYMWWDVFYAWPDPNDAARAAEAEEYLNVMERCLSLSHQGCLEGALHGLGHWQLLFPDRVKTIINKFLSQRSDLRPELIRYAEGAREGNVQ